MAKKPLIFQPDLTTPQGLNNYSGVTFRCFTIGDTLPFKFTFSNKDGSALDVTGWQVKIAIASAFNALGGLLVDIPLASLEDCIFEGDVRSIDTIVLTPGVNYALAKYIMADGKEHIIDMCMLEVYPNLNFVTPQGV